MRKCITLCMLLMAMSSLCSSLCLSLWAAESVEPADTVWPPVMDALMPNISLTNLQGEKIKLHSVSDGKPVLIEYVGVSCPGCNALMGANDKKIGVFPGQRAQAGLDSVGKSLKAYSKGIKITDERFVFVVIILYGVDLKAPTLEAAQAFAKHYKLTEHKNHVVLFGDASFINPASYNLIPGFQLADMQWTLVSDSTGHHPKHAYWDHTFPKLKKLIRKAQHQQTGKGSIK